MEKWAEVVRKDAAPAAPLPPVVSAQDVSENRSAQGLRTVVVDANALINGINLSGLAFEMCTIREAVDEVRDPKARAQLEALPFTLKILEPTPESMSKVVQFARATGDLQALSQADLKLLALAHSLEVQAHGDGHLSSRPPPLIFTPVEKHRQQDPPGWGSNVPNPEEWEELPDHNEASAGGEESHILGLKDLHLDTSKHEEAAVAAQHTSAAEEATNSAQSGKPHFPRRNRKKRSEKVKLTTKGKVMVSEGVDASKGEHGDGDDWQKAGSRSTRKKHLRKAAAAAAAFSSAASTAADDASAADVDSAAAAAAAVDSAAADDDDDSAAVSDLPAAATVADDDERKASDIDECSESEEEEEEDDDDDDDDDDDGVSLSQEEARLNSLERKDSEVASVDEESVDSWHLRPLWKSTIACMTTDFPMQNVILQMGLRLFTPTGLQVRELHRWVLKCHACSNVTAEVGRIFCPKCGNGGTLFRISVTIGSNGTVQGGCLRRPNIRGTRYSIPAPKGGREGALVNPILREDQLPHKLLHPKIKKKACSDDGLEMMSSFEDVVNKKTKNRNGCAMRVRAAAVMLSGRRNPNDAHYAKKH